jgi:photosystem II stability/assembly factor-like uncharacterized protein
VRESIFPTCPQMGYNPGMLLLLLACSDPVDSTSPEKPVVEEPEVPAWCPDPGPAPVLEDWSAPSHAPGGWGAFVVPTNDPQVVYVGAIYGGLYQSLDGGQSWRLLVNRAPPHTYGQVAWDPADPTRVIYSVGDVYLLEGESFRALGVGGLEADRRVRGLLWNDTGIYAVDSGGRVLHAADPSGPFETRASLPSTMAPPPHVAMESIGADYFHLVSTPGALLAAGEGRALYRSIDGGYTWSEVISGMVMGHTLVSRGRDVWVANGTTVLHSADEGLSWTVWATLLDMPVAAALRDDGALAVAESGRLWLWEGAESAAPVTLTVQTLGLGWLGDGSLLLGHIEGLQRSGDGGQSWSDAGTQGYWDDNLSVVVAHPLCPGLVWAGTECQRGWYRSEDWGQSWTHMGGAYMHYVMDAAVDPHDPKRLWVTTDDHVLRSPDLGETWEEVFPSKVHMHGLGVDPLVPGRVLVGSVGSGDYKDSSGKVYRSNDDGLQWVDSSAGLPTFPGSVQGIAWSDQTPDLVLAATYRGGIFHEDGEGVGLYRSVDGGQSWSQILEEEQSLVKVVFCEGRFYALTQNQLYVSEDEGQSWDMVQTTGRLTSVGCGDGKVLLRGSSKVWLSEDGVEWEVQGGELPKVESLGAAEGIATSAGMMYTTQNGGGMYMQWIGD